MTSEPPSGGARVAQLAVSSLTALLVAGRRDRRRAGPRPAACPAALVADPGAQPDRDADPRPAPVAGRRGAGCRADAPVAAAGAARRGAGRRRSRIAGARAARPARSSSTSPPARCCSTGTPERPGSPRRWPSSRPRPRSLTALGPEHRLDDHGWSPVRRAAASVVLVGGGDATLTTRRPRPGDLPAAGQPRRPRRRHVVAAAARRRPPAVTVLVDDSLFTGPAVSPDWPATYLSSGVVSPVSALSVDAGRVRPGSVAREADPALAAGRELARLLRSRGVDVAPRRHAGAAQPPNAPRCWREVVSPTVAEMVELELCRPATTTWPRRCCGWRPSGRPLPASFEGGTTAVARRAGRARRTDRRASSLLDGSGLARGSRSPRSAPGAAAAARRRRARTPTSRRCSTACRSPGFSGTLETALPRRRAGGGRRSGAGQDRHPHRGERPRRLTTSSRRSPGGLRGDGRPGARGRDPAGPGRPRPVRRRCSAVASGAKNPGVRGG